MIRTTSTSFDVAILGTGFSSTVLAAILARQGADVLLIDSGVHPRFAVGESTIPHTSLLLSMLAERFDVPEIDHLAHPEAIAAHVCSSCGIKRTFGFAYHREGEAHLAEEGLQFGTSSKDENHLFRQDVDAYLLHVAMHYGASVRLQTCVETIELSAQGVTLESAAGESFDARFLVDGSGYKSPLAEKLELRDRPTRLRHHSRTLFTHMIGVEPFAEASNPLSLSWHESTLHHVFAGGWFWVIPFDNRPGSTNPLVSVGLTLDPRRYPRLGPDAEAEFQSFLERFPSVAGQFERARAVRPWVSTDRVQYSSHDTTGARYCLMSHAAGFVDPLYSRGLINSLEVVAALVDPLLTALESDVFVAESFRPIDDLQQRVLDYNDQLVACSFASWVDFDLWNAWARVWALGTILAEFRAMNALADYRATGDLAALCGVAADPVFSDFEDPDYRVFFGRAVGVMNDFEARGQSAAATARRLLDLTAEYEFSVPLRLDSMQTAGWLEKDEFMSERNLEIARRGYRWALANPTSRDLFGNSEALLRWRSQRADRHLEARESEPMGQARLGV